MTETEAIAALNALHSPDPDGWKPGTPTDYMTCKGCDVLTLGGGSRRLWKDCPTRAILARVGSGAVPPHDIDCDALIAELRATVQRPDRDQNAPVVLGSNVIDLGAFADRVLAVVRPVEGVTLTPEETTLAIHALRDPQALSFSDEDLDRMLALAARLEASS